MSRHAHRMQWGVLFALAAGLVVLTHARAEQSTDGPADLDAEVQQAAEEEAAESKMELEERAAKFQTMFSGTYRRISAVEGSPDVIGEFLTDMTDKKPGRRYLVKADSKALGAQLGSFEGKKVKLGGKLRNYGPDGEAKYLIVTQILISQKTPPSVQRRSVGGI